MIKQLIIQKPDVSYFAVFKSLLTILSIFLDVNNKVLPVVKKCEKVDRSILSWYLFSLLNSLNIGTTGSHVPHESQDHVHATFMPAPSSKQVTLELILGWNRIPVLTTSEVLSTPHQWFGFTRLHDSYLTQS